MSTAVSDPVEIMTIGYKPLDQLWEPERGGCEELAGFMQQTGLDEIPCEENSEGEIVIRTKEPVDPEGQVDESSHLILVPESQLAIFVVPADHLPIALGEDDDHTCRISHMHDVIWDKASWHRDWVEEVLVFFVIVGKAPCGRARHDSADWGEYERPITLSRHISHHPVLLQAGRLASSSATLGS
ncbi:hypothetical protein J8273_1065 [Carpediemonas membranifera]|uniref:Uncharacterized protein n=1 Tax=Carpediemonas membranifera TaxID=201153 RepID=A0A8J6AXB1_9EUKA|nr:hypothetical protein J8273_1065 [Carpediemonas membranifera]|eukprot:KAG9397156.1 hypothetical protein J8273_1065 [Carpediemonas membranifera]